MRDYTSSQTEPRPNPFRPDRTQIFRFAISLLIAVLLWGWVTEVNDPFMTINYRELDISTGQLDDSLRIVTTLPRASVTLRGPESELTEIQRNQITVTLDTSDVSKPGEYRLKLIVTTPDGPSEQSVDPKELSVTIEEEVSRVLPIEVRRIIPDNDPREISTINPDTTQVTVTGPSSAVDRVDKVLLPVNIDNHPASFEDSFTPYAIDDKGQRVSEVDILPDEIKTRVEVQTRGKRISVIPEVIGVPAEGYSMRQRSVLPDSVVVDGPEEALESLLFVNTESVDISGASKSISREVALANLPEGVSVIEPRKGKVEVRVAIEDTSGTAQTLTDLPVTFVNLDPGLEASLTPDTIDVTVDGPSAILTDMTPEDVKIRVDLTGLDPGTHELKPEITVPQGVTWISNSPETVEVVITVGGDDAGTPAPSPEANLPVDVANRSPATGPGETHISG